MNIRIITDSASDLRPPHRPEVTVQPMTVTFGREEYQDGINLTHRQFYDRGGRPAHHQPDIPRPV